MAGQTLFTDFHRQRGDEEPEFIRAPQGHSGSNVDIYFHSFSYRIGERVRSISVPFGTSTDEPSIIAGELVPGGCGHSQGRKAVYFSLASPLDEDQTLFRSTSPYLFKTRHMKRLYVIDLDMAIATHRTAASCATTPLRPNSSSNSLTVTMNEKRSFVHRHRVYPR